MFCSRVVRKRVEIRQESGMVEGKWERDCCQTIERGKEGGSNI